MRALAIASVLTACRWHFDAVIDGDANDGDGSLIDPTGDATPISGVQATLSSTGTCAAVAWSGDRAGITWREANTDVWFATVAPSGAFVEAPMRIGMDLANLGCPAIAWTGARFVVAMSFGALNQQDIETATITGTATTAFINVTADSAGSTTPRLAVGPGNAVLLAWTSLQGNRTDVLARSLTAMGATSGATQTASAEQPTNSGAAIAPMSNGFFVAWTGQPNLFERTFTLTGAMLGAETGFGTLPQSNGRVGVAWTGTDAFLAWSPFGGAQVNVARIDAAGTVTLAPVTHALMRAQEFDGVWTGDRFGVLYNETYGLVQAHLAQFAADGTLINDVPVVSSTTTTTVGLAWTGTQYVAAVQSNQGVIVKFIDPP